MGWENKNKTILRRFVLLGIRPRGITENLYYRCWMDGGVDAMGSLFTSVHWLLASGHDGSGIECKVAFGREIEKLSIDMLV